MTSPKSDKAVDLQADPSCAGQAFSPLIPLRRAQKLHGLEATADWRVNRQWTLGGLITYQKGEYTEPGATPVPFGADTLSPPRFTLYAEAELLPKWRNRLQGTYFGEMQTFVDMKDVMTGFWKSLSFGVIVMWVATYKGFNVGHGAEGVARATTQSVVLASVLILVWDYFLGSVLP